MVSPRRTPCLSRGRATAERRVPSRAARISSVRDSASPVVGWGLAGGQPAARTAAKAELTASTSVPTSSTSVLQFLTETRRTSPCPASVNRTSRPCRPRSRGLSRRAWWHRLPKASETCVYRHALFAGLRRIPAARVSATLSGEVFLPDIGAEFDDQGAHHQQEYNADEAASLLHGSPRAQVAAGHVGQAQQQPDTPED